jgi:hypothetical protein
MLNKCNHEMYNSTTTVGEPSIYCSGCAELGSLVPGGMEEFFACPECGGDLLPDPDNLGVLRCTECFYGWEN